MKEAWYNNFSIFIYFIYLKEKKKIYFRYYCIIILVLVSYVRNDLKLMSKI